MPAAIPIALAIGSAASAGATVYAAKKQSQAANQAATWQSDAAQQAAALEAQSNANQLDFLKSQDAERQKEWQSTQDRNYQIYQGERGQKLGALQPYTTLGQLAIGQLQQPIYGNGQAPTGTLRDVMGGR